MLQFEQEIQEYNKLHNTYACVLSCGMPFYQIIASEISRIQKQHEHSLILLINCEKRARAIEMHANFKIVQLTSDLMTQRRANTYFTGGVLCTSIRTLAIDLLSLRLSPTLINGIFIILSRQLLDVGTYLPMIFDTYLRGNKDVYR